jgi:hypothetical protein
MQKSRAMTKILALSFLLCTTFLNGIIVESPKFAIIKKYIEKSRPEKVLIVCDVDNTLLRAAQHFGSVQWGDYIIDKLINNGVSEKNSGELGGMLWRFVQPFIEVQNVDPETPMILQDIQDKGFLILGLTARSPIEAGYTINQLRVVGINLGKLRRQFTFESLSKEKKELSMNKEYYLGLPIIRNLTSY